MALIKNGVYGLICCYITYVFISIVVWLFVVLGIFVVVDLVGNFNAVRICFATFWAKSVLIRSVQWELNSVSPKSTIKNNFWPKI